MVTPNGTNGINGFGGFDDERETLLHTALFKQVSSEEARELLPYLQHAEYDKGDFIFREGDTDHRMYLLEEGRVKLTRQSSDKRVSPHNTANSAAPRNAGSRPPTADPARFCTTSRSPTTSTRKR